VRSDLTRPLVLVAILVVLWTGIGTVAQAVTVSRTDSVLNVQAPGFSFIKGEPLTRLKDGRSIRVDLEMAVLPRPAASGVARSRQTFVLSYDLWEERFAVTLVGTSAKTAAYLSSSAAETWCFEQLSVPMAALGSLARDSQFWIRLEYRILDSDPQASAEDGTGYTLQSLIEMLSRRRKINEWTHAIEAGPFKVKP
jgi:hypothetical protein